MKNAVKIFIATLFLPLALYITAQTSFASYKDVPEDYKYKKGVDFLELLGATDSGDYFRPDAEISRAEFFKILFKVFREETTNSAGITLTDVPKDAWFAPYARLAIQNNLVEGSLFEPAKTLKRIDALSFLLKAYGIEGGITPWKNRTQIFKDVPKTSPYYSVVSRAVTAEVFKSNTTSTWRPFDKITRGELADMMFNFENWHNNELMEEAANERNKFYKSDIFANIWKKITNNFYVPEGQTIDEQALFEAAIKGMLETLNDPYTTYFSSTQATEFTDSLSGEFEGIGAVLYEDELAGTITISSFVEGSPAAKSGLKIGDAITAVDGVSISGMTIDDVISRIKGAKNTVVNLTILRGENTYNFKITRAVIAVDLISGEIIFHDYWFIDIDTFASNTAQEMMETIRALETEVTKPKGIVIDLRSNGGGYLSAGNFVAGLFVPQLTPLVTLDYGGGYKETIYNGDTGPYKGIPLYFFVDKYTASASEILVQTLKETADTTVIGTQTFGKGSAQSLTDYWDGSAFKVTIAHWLSSGGTSIQGVGITPDITIDENQEDSSDEDAYMTALEKAL
ncbi:MAG: S41 family peptidase [Candidatus Gracilibacteria bacterium]|jgi:C-terminal peptidase prc